MKPRPRRGEPIGFVRPAELRQQRRRIEDAAPDPLGPIVLDEPDQAQLVDVRVGGCRRVEQQHAVRSGSRRERLAFNPPPHGARQPVDGKRRVIVRWPARRPATRARRRPRRARARAAAPRPRRSRRRALVRPDEIEQRVKLPRGASGPRAAAAAPLRPLPRRGVPPPASARGRRRVSPLFLRLRRLGANAACPASAFSRSQPPKYFSSRSRASSALTRARTDTSDARELRELPVRRAQQIDG